MNRSKNRTKKLRLILQKLLSDFLKLIDSPAVYYGSDKELYAACCSWRTRVIRPILETFHSKFLSIFWNSPINSHSNDTSIITRNNTRRWQLMAAAELTVRRRLRRDSRPRKGVFFRRRGGRWRGGCLISSFNPSLRVLRTEAEPNRTRI